jgi:hypothetical protein
MAHLIGSDNPSETFVHPIWLFRVVPSLCLAALILAQTVAAHRPQWHDLLVGFATGLLVTLCVVGFSAKAIVMKDSPQTSDVQDLRITR